MTGPREIITAQHFCRAVIVNDRWALGAAIATTLFIVLFAAGIFVQARELKAKK